MLRKWILTTILMIASATAAPACPGSLAIGLPLLFGADLPNSPWPGSGLDASPSVDLTIPVDLDEAQDAPPARKEQAIECLKSWRQLVREGRFAQAGPVAAKAASLDPTNIDAQHAVIVSKTLIALVEQPASKATCESACSKACTSTGCCESGCPIAQLIHSRNVQVEFCLPQAICAWVKSSACCSQGDCAALAHRVRDNVRSTELPGAEMSCQGLVMTETRTATSAVGCAQMTENGLVNSLCETGCPRSEVVQLRRGELKTLPTNTIWDVTYGQKGLEVIQRNAIRLTSHTAPAKSTTRVRIVSKDWTVECDHAATTDGSEMVLEGDVRLASQRLDMVVNAGRVRINLTTGAIRVE